MRIGKRLFPYPVINQASELSGFKDCEFSIEYEMEQDESNYILKNAHINLTSKKLESLLMNGKARAVVVVECSYTVYRKVFPIDIEPSDIFIPTFSVRNKFEISCFIYAIDDFTFSSDEFLDDYDGYEFEIEKYDILAIDDGFQVKVEQDESKDKKVSSIFTIVKSNDPFMRLMKIESRDRKINITLPEEQFEIYDSLKNIDLFKNIFFATIAIPALVKYFAKFKEKAINTNYRIEDIVMDYGWFESVINAYSALHDGEELTDAKLSYMEPEELAQDVINHASITSLDDLREIFRNNSKKGEEDDE